MNKFIFIFVAFLSACASWKTDSDLDNSALIETYVNDAPTASGKRLTGSLKELERIDAQSIVEVQIASGDAVPATLFTLRGMCNIMRARKEQYFNYSVMTQKPLRYRVNFPKSATSEQLQSPNKQVFSNKDCEEIRLS